MSAASDKNIIELQEVQRTYRMGEGQVHALCGVSFTIAEGDFVAIMGASGSGKSSLLNILGCLDRPTKGRYFLDGIDVARLSKDDLAKVRNKKIGFVFQSFNLLARTSALENVELPLIYSDIPGRERKRRAEEALASVGLAPRSSHYPSQLSGGEQQRVAIARALVNSPVLLLADEPTGNLDSNTGSEIMEMFGKLNQEQGRTIVLVTHEHHIGQYAFRRIVFKDGMILNGGGPA